MSQPESRFWTPGRLVGALAILVAAGGAVVGALAIVRAMSITAFVEAVREENLDGVHGNVVWLDNRGWLVDALRKVLSEHETQSKFSWGKSVHPSYRRCAS